MKSCKGFTLMELMIVIAIIMILAGAIVARMSTSTEQAKIAKAKTELEQLASSCRAFYADTGLWPRAIGDLILTTSTPPTNGYNETRTNTAITAGTFKGPYIEAVSVPNDPWNRAYQFYYDTATKTFFVRTNLTSGNYRVLVHIFQ